KCAFDFSVPSVTLGFNLLGFFMPADEILRQHLGADAFTSSDFRGDHRVVVPNERVFDGLQILKVRAGFDLLVDITAGDYLYCHDAADRFGVVYMLANTATGERLIVKTLVNEPDLSLPSAVPLWKGADWMEREVYDMYGITFTGHPDLRRIL